MITGNPNGKNGPCDLLSMKQGNSQRCFASSDLLDVENDLRTAKQYNQNGNVIMNDVCRKNPSGNETILNETQQKVANLIDDSVTGVTSPTTEKEDCNESCNKYFSSGSQRPLNLNISRSMNERLLSAPSSPTHSCACNFQQSPSRKSSMQFKKLSFRKKTLANALSEKRLTLLGKPIQSGGKTKLNLSHRLWQSRVFNFLEQPQGLEVLYHMFTFLLVFSSLVFSILATVPQHEAYATEILFWMEILLLIIFAVELSLRIWSSGCKCRYQGLMGLIRFCKKPFSLIDIIVVLSSLLVISFGAQVNMFAATTMKSLRFLQILRLVRVDRKGGTWKLLSSVVMAHRKELITAWYIGFLTLILASFVVYQVEKDSNKSHFNTYADGLWWGLITLVTIGYGDKVPATWLGRLLACGFTIIGTSFFALPAGILGSGFALKVQEQHRQKHFARRRMPAAFLIQCTWRCYAADQNSSSVATWLPHQRANFNKQRLLNNTSPSFPTKNSFRSKAIAKSIISSNHFFLNDHQSPPSPGLNMESKQEITKFSAFTERLSDKLNRHSMRRSKREKKSSEKKNHESAVNVGDVFDEISLSSSNNEAETTVDLTEQQKVGIRCIRAIKLMVARRKFKEALRPYDVKDVIEQYSSGHLEMLTRIKNLQNQVDIIVGANPDAIFGHSSSFHHRIRSTADGHDHGFSTSMNHRLLNVEINLQHADEKLDLILQTLKVHQNLDLPNKIPKKSRKGFKKSDFHQPLPSVQVTTDESAPECSQQPVSDISNSGRINPDRMINLGEDNCFTSQEIHGSEDKRENKC